MTLFKDAVLLLPSCCCCCSDRDPPRRCDSIADGRVTSRVSVRTQLTPTPAWMEPARGQLTNSWDPFYLRAVCAPPNLRAASPGGPAHTAPLHDSLTAPVQCFVCPAITPGLGAARPRCALRLVRATLIPARPARHWRPCRVCVSYRVPVCPHAIRDARAPRVRQHVLSPPLPCIVQSRLYT